MSDESEPRTYDWFRHAITLNAQRRAKEYEEGRKTGAHYLLECMDTWDCRPGDEENPDAGVYFVLRESADEVDRMVKESLGDDSEKVLGIFDVKRPLAPQGGGIHPDTWARIRDLLPNPSTAAIMEMLARVDLVPVVTDGFHCLRQTLATYLPRPPNEGISLNPDSQEAAEQSLVDYHRRKDALAGMRRLVKAEKSEEFLKMLLKLGASQEQLEEMLWDLDPMLKMPKPN